jgi:hypothetical protein
VYPTIKSKELVSYTRGDVLHILLLFYMHPQIKKTEELQLGKQVNMEQNEEATNKYNCKKRVSNTEKRTKI